MSSASWLTGRSTVELVGAVARERARTEARLALLLRLLLLLVVVVLRSPPCFVFSTPFSSCWCCALTLVVIAVAESVPRASLSLSRYSDLTWLAITSCGRTKRESRLSACLASLFIAARLWGPPRSLDPHFPSPYMEPLTTCQTSPTFNSLERRCLSGVHFTIEIHSILTSKGTYTGGEDCFLHYLLLRSFRYNLELSGKKERGRNHLDCALDLAERQRQASKARPRSIVLGVAELVHLFRRTR